MSNVTGNASGEPVAWRVRPKNSTRAWSFHDDPEIVAFYAAPDVTGGPYDVVPLYTASLAGIDHPTGFTWTRQMYEAFDKLPGSPRPHIDVLLALYQALKAAVSPPPSESGDGQ